LDECAGSGHLQHEALHLRHKLLQLGLQPRPLAAHLAHAAVANGVLQDLGRDGGVAGAKDHDAALQLQQGASGELVIARRKGAVRLLDAPGKFKQKRTAELHQELRVAAGLVQCVVAVKGGKGRRCGFDMDGHD
jgi:hypothetical protein